LNRLPWRQENEAAQKDITLIQLAFDPAAALRRCAYTRLPVSRKKSVKTRQTRS
jgi:hypothetical protein